MRCARTLVVGTVCLVLLGLGGPGASSGLDGRRRTSGACAADQ